MPVSTNKVLNSGFYDRRISWLDLICGYLNIRCRYGVLI